MASSPEVPLAFRTAASLHPVRQALARQLIGAGKLTEAGAQRAERLATESGERFEVVLARLGLASERDIAEQLAALLALPLAGAADYPEVAVLAHKLSPQFLREAQVIPLADGPSAVALAMVDPLNDYGAEAARFASGKPILRHVAVPADFGAAFERLYGSGTSEIRRIVQDSRARPDEAASEDADRIRDSGSDAPIVRLVHLLITRAVEARASDIHIEPMDGDLRVRYRIDGVLHEVEAPPRSLAASVISRIKVMAKLNIAERRIAQDGRIRLAVRGKDVDFRVSIMPTIHGECAVLRILDRGHLTLDFATLGFDEPTIGIVRSLLQLPHGILLATGPTGSGKTTTLYAGLTELNTKDRKILTIEDPVEYQLPGINQVQVKPQIGLTFASALRGFLRQDPDIMMVGEIRDLETAQVAVQAALTGHLILSTVHTNDAPSTITRLLDMGVEDYLLTSTVSGVIAQRLVRSLCLHCRKPYTADPPLLERLQIDARAPITLYAPGGCVRCGGTGFQGRSSIVEVLTMNEALRHLVLARTETSALRQAAADAGMRSMHAHGMQKVVAGQTTVEEVLRATRSS
ncbi:MAG: Flp pilus assembly complex ATPase component TadA [Alphaproteobacteria bacterium]|nr:Flp pilus assembly complex ATPase component TadA [Alphaproteobacteria bacterium]MBL6940375.1 Flp pilus assembly complex ATPase component TadA [Alphaproteobacteria bacterium]MBL7099094.1 Flp pilus assembly complex ATPase component TadA [Alphaproteobacteria bacterium]